MRRDEGQVRSFGLDAGSGGLVPPQPAGWAQLVSVRDGVVELRSESARAFVTRDVAVWMPAGVPYALDLRTPARLRILYVDANRSPRRSFEPVEKTPEPVEMTPLLRELIERAVARGFLDPDDTSDENLLAVIFEELADLRTERVASVLILPRDVALRALADARTTHPENLPTVAALAASIGLPLRTFERRFAAEMGFSPRDWLRRVRLAAAIVALSTGESVTEAGLACGYASTSAFISAFRAVYGTTPGAYGARVSQSHRHATLLE